MSYEDNYWTIEQGLKELSNIYSQTRYDLIKKMIVGKTILDVGAGLGLSCEKYKGKGKVTAVDLNQKYVDYMKEHGINAELADVNDLPFPDDSFDTVIASEIIEHIDNPGIGLAECFRVAKEKVIITLPIMHHDIWHRTLVKGEVIDIHGGKFLFIELIKRPDGEYKVWKREMNETTTT